MGICVSAQTPSILALLPGQPPSHSVRIPIASQLYPILLETPGGGGGEEGRNPYAGALQKKSQDYSAGVDLGRMSIRESITRARR